MPPSTLLTAEQFILNEQQRRHPHASGEFSWLLSGITLATKFIAAQISRGGLVGVLGSAEATNVQGETQQKLDVLANQTLLDCLGNRGNVGILASEENEEPTVVLKDPQYGKYVVIFDPLDGSSNIDVNVSVGTIFSILRRDDGAPPGRDPLADVLQPGTRQVAAGYVVYGASTMLVFSTGEGVHGFTLDPSIGAYMLTHRNIRMPEQGPYYSVNEANLASFPPAYATFLADLREGRAGPRVLVAVRRLAGGRFSSHAAQGGHLSLSAHAANTPKASCGCCTRPTRSPSSPSRPAAWRATAEGGFSTSSPPACTSGRRWSSAAATRCRD